MPGDTVPAAEGKMLGMIVAAEHSQGDGRMDHAECLDQVAGIALDAAFGSKEFGDQQVDRGLGEDHRDDRANAAGHPTGQTIPNSQRVRN